MWRWRRSKSFERAQRRALAELSALQLSPPSRTEACSVRIAATGFAIGRSSVHVSSFGLDLFNAREPHRLLRFGIRHAPPTLQWRRLFALSSVMPTSRLGVT